MRDYCVYWIIGWVACWIAFMFVLFTLDKLVIKKWLDTSSIPCCLSTFFSFFLSQSRQLLDTWWIDRESSCFLNSSSTPGGSIELLFLDLLSCSSIPQLSTTISSIPASNELYWGFIYTFFAIQFSFLQSLSICPHLFISQTLSLSLQTSSFVIFQDYSSLGKFLIFYSSWISCFET